MFKKLLKKGDQDRQETPPASPNRQNARNTTEAQGFICPMCMVSLASAEALQQHFYNQHEGDMDGAGNSALTELSPSTMRKLTKNELDMNKQLLKASEESRTLLGAEVHSLQSQLKQLTQEMAATKEERTVYQNKAATLAGDVAGCKARADESEAQKKAHEDHIVTLKTQLLEKTNLAQALETQLSERPSADDVAVLKKELVQVQTVMDESAKDREGDRARLSTDLESSKLQLERSTERIKELEIQIASRPKDEEVQRLQAILSTKEETSVAQSEVIHQRDLSIQSLQSQLDQESQKLAAVQKQLEDQTTDLANTRISLADKSTEITDLCERIKTAEESLNLKTTELELIKANKEKLKEDLNKKCDELFVLKNTLSSTQQQSSQSESLLHQLQDENRQLTKQNEKAKEENLLKTKNAETLREELNQLRSSLQEARLQREQELGAVKVQLEKATTQLESKTSQLDEVNSQLKTATENYHKECSNNDELMGRLREKDSVLETETRNSITRDEKIISLESQLAGSLALSQRQEVERHDLLAKIEGGEGTETAINQLKTENTLLQEKITNSEQSLKDLAENSHTKQEQLHQDVQQVKGQLHAAQEKTRKFKTTVAERDDKIASLDQKILQLEGDLLTKNELLVASDSAKASQRLDLENHIHTVQASLTDRTTELEKLKSTLVEVQTELSSKVEKLSSTDQKLSEEMKKLSEANVSLTNANMELQTQGKSLEKCRESEKKLKSKLEDTTKRLKDSDTTTSKLTEKIKNEKKIHDENTRKLQQQCDDIKQKFEAEKNTLSTELEKELLSKNDCLIEIDRLKNDASKLEEELDNLRTQQQELGENLKNEKNTVGKLSESEQSLKCEVTKLTEDKHALSNQIAELETEVESTNIELASQITKYDQSIAQNLESEMKLNSELKESHDNVSKLELEIEVLSKAKADLETSLTSSQEHVVQLDCKLTSVNDEKDQLTQELKDVTTKCTNVELEKQRLEDEINISNLKEDDLQKSLQTLTEEKENKTTELVDIRQTLAQTTEENNNLIAQKEKTEEELRHLKSVCTKLETATKSQLSKIVALEESLETVNVQRTEEVATLTEAKELLLKQKLDLQTEVTNLTEQVTNEQTKMEELKTSVGDIEGKLKDENTLLQEKCKQLSDDCERYQREKEETAVRNDLQLTTLNDNLTVVRADLTLNQDALDQSNRLADELRGQRLELEAKLENNNDERRVLLERCLESETECEKLRDKTTELRRRLEDTQGALHDLGRENQSLQITTVKAQNRRWADDNEVVDCMACSKIFTVKIRKHHCRHCGNIFCQECSSKQASTPSSKKAVRVCEECYNNLTQT